MSVSERTLRKWRREALRIVDISMYDNSELSGIALMYEQARKRILSMTGELLDQHLLRHSRQQRESEKKAMKKTFEIYFNDLVPSAQIDLCREFSTDPEEENWEDVPLAIIEREEED